MNQIAKHIIFSGRVQGVGFRFTAHNIARRHQLAGTVRNLPDGTVEMIVQGPSQDVSDCITDIKNYFGNSIKDTKINHIPVNPQLINFKITF